MTRIRCLFLDLDGVCNSGRYFDERDGLAPGERRFRIVVSSSDPIDPVAIARVQRIVDATGAQIVISSSWRLGRSLESLRAMLVENGLRAEVIDVTPWGIGRRGEEIQAWLRDAWQDVESWVAIDDESPEEMHPCGERHVQTGWAEGLTDELADKAIAILLRDDHAALPRLHLARGRRRRHRRPRT